MHNLMDILSREQLNTITIAICYVCLIIHWYTEIRSQRITNFINGILFIVGIFRLIYPLTEKAYWFYLLGMALCAFIPWVVFNMGYTFGGGTYKLMIASGLILGTYQALAILVISPFIYNFYVKWSERNKKKYLPSGVSVLIMLPFQFLFLI